MTATAPRSSATSKASRSAARRSAASDGLSACPRSGAAGLPSTGPAAPGVRRWAASSSSTAVSSVLQDLGIGYIAAHSPQAKGRVERLWETLQDRLVAELRLQGIQTVAAAEAFLPTYLVDHNRRLTQPPTEPTPAESV